MSIFVAPRPAKAVAKAGPVGPGSSVLLTEFPLSGNGRPTPQKRMQRAWALSFEIPWIAAAEDAINERFASVDWHLEDDQDETIDDAYPNPDAQAARMLLEKPSAGASVGAPFYRSDLWALTSRAMGICGSGFIFLDQREALAGTPKVMLPVAPWRMYPEEDPAGNLIGWSIDKSPTDPGIPVTLDEILHYQLRRNFVGHFGVGLMESAMRKAAISNGLDDHISMVLSAGGRLSGILSPQSGNIDPDTMLQMERDWRTVVEQADAAKRLQLVRAPVKFDRTTLTPAEMQVRDLMVGGRDDLLTLWGVPLSIIGGTTPAGLNSGDTRKYDEAAIWQGPVHHRLNVFRETTQYQLLDRYQLRGATVELELEEPEFDDDSPRYDLLGKSLNSPMRNVERRALIGLPPFGDPALDNAIILPATIVPYATAPDEADEATPTAVVLGRTQEETVGNPEALAAAGETSLTEPKAALPSRLGKRVAPLHASLVRYREHAQTSMTPLLKTAVAGVLSAQKSDIVARLRKHADHIAKHPADTSIWFDKGWDAKLRGALAPRLEAVAHVVNAQVHDVLPPLPAKASPPGAVERVMSRGAARITKINDTTKAKVQDAIARALEQGLSVTAAADLIEGIPNDAIGLDLGSLFDDYRSEMIARTELMDAYNGAALGSYGDAGVTQVQAIDGDGDPECAERDGQTFDIDEADTIEDHPNGTLDWIPVLEDYPVEAKAVSQISSQPTWSPVVNVNFGERSLVVDHHSDIHIPEQPAPIVQNTVNVPEQPAPTVVVAPAVVNVDAPVTVNNPEPVVTILPVKEPTRKVLDRDRNGLITGSHEEP